jgi:TPR repeat protein
MLGLLYEYDEKYKEAWICYFKRYSWVGIGAEDLAHLYIDKGYRPDNVKFDEVISMLDMSARNGNEVSLNYLIDIFSDVEFCCQNLDKVQEYKKIGANLGLPDKMFEFGLSLMDGNEVNFNAYKGLEWIEKSARKEHLPAIEYLLETYNTGDYQDYEKLKEWALVAARMELTYPSIFFLILNGLRKNAKDELKSYLIYNITEQNDNELDALKVLAIEYSNKMIELTDDEVNTYFKRASELLNSSVPLHDDNKIQLQSVLYKLDRDFAPSMVEDKQILDGELFEKYYNYCWASNFDLYDIETKDNFLNSFYNNTSVNFLS